MNIRRFLLGFSILLIFSEVSAECQKYEPQRIILEGILLPLDENGFNEQFELKLENNLCIPVGVNPIIKDRETEHSSLKAVAHGSQQLDVFRKTSGKKITLDGVIFFSNEGQPSLMVVEIKAPNQSLKHGTAQSASP